MSKIIDSLGAAWRNISQKKEVTKDGDTIASSEVEATLFAVPAECIDSSSLLLQRYPALGDLLTHVHVSQPYLPVQGEYGAKTFQAAAGRSASLKNKRYVLDLQLLGMTEESTKVTFYPDIKGVGSLDFFLEETLQQHRPDLSEQERAKILTELAPQLLMTWKTEGYDRPFGSQTAYLEKHSSQQDYLFQEGYHIKMAPYVGTLALPLGIMKKIVEISHRLGLQRQIGIRQTYRPDATVEDFTFVQEVRLLPGDIRGHDITHSTESRRKEIVREFDISPEEFPHFINRLLADAAAYIQLFPQGLRKDDTKLLFVGISDLMTSHQTKEKFTKAVEPTILLLKDIVISDVGLFFVDWESVDTHSEISPESIDTLVQAYTVGFLSELTRVITEFIIIYQELPNKELTFTAKSDIEQAIFKAIISKLDQKLVKATFSGQDIIFEFCLLGEWRKYTLKKSDFPWKYA